LSNLPLAFMVIGFLFFQDIFIKGCGIPRPFCFWVVFRIEIQNLRDRL
jgi:hypothetical protein